jgi:transcriptional regulator with PAS, ATPase and Fis domain
MGAADHLLELLFSQSLDGFFFMMLDEPVQWNDDADKEGLLDYIFTHQRMTKVNDAMLAQYGATRDAFIGLTPAEIYRHDPAQGRRVWRDFFDRGQLHIKTHERRLDGTPIDIEGDYICLYDAERRIIGHFGIQRDVTEEVRLQASVARHAAELETRVAERTGQLARSEIRIRAIVNALPDVVFVLDEEGRYVEVVTEDDRRLYRSVPELLGRRVDEVLPESAATSLREVTTRSIASGSVQVVEYPLDTHSGIRWFEGRCAPLPPQRGGVRGGDPGLPMEDGGGARHVVVIARDITDRKRADELEHQNVYLREAFDTDLHFGEIHGRSAAMQQVFRAIELVANTDTSVLIFGETGTGKELIARAIHRSSRRMSAVMVKVNCGALPATLVESELFGHERGAFTGAVQQKKGRFELANRGTIFLDEVGELPLESQVKLLRVLQEHEFERVGGTQTVRADARVIAATNRDLKTDVQRGTFRPDLFFRLNIFPIWVPALRDRRDDIPILARHFVREFAARMGRTIDQIDGKALDQLVTYNWPGNVRELANILERAVILCQGRALQSAHLGLPTSPAASIGEEVVTLDEAERRHILRALEKTGGVLAGPKGAAALLGINRSTLWSRMRKLGIDPVGS